MKINGNNALKDDHAYLAVTPKVLYKDFFATENIKIQNGLETPLKEDAFELADEEKIEKISFHFRQIMDVLGLDLSDDSLKDTPKRVAKMYVKEIFYGLDPKNKPVATLFENKYGYSEMLIEKDITVKSYCEHHFVPILGKAHVAYIPNGKVIGLSKINRIVDYYSRRPQVQERLTLQIAEELKNALQTEDVAVIVDSVHMCVTTRGVKDENSSTYTSSFHGKFKDFEFKSDFLRQLK